MPPARPRAPHDDSKPDSKDRTATTSSSAAVPSTTGTRPRKAAAAAAAAASATTSTAANTAKPDTASIASSGATASTRAAAAAAAGNGSLNHGSSVPGLTWTAEDSKLLHAYRNAHGLPTPPAFRASLSAAVLNMPGIGRQSPTMARRRDGRKKVPKEQLALAVRKHFNGLAVNETDVVVDFLYAIRNQDRGFKMRFAPKRQR